MVSRGKDRCVRLLKCVEKSIASMRMIVLQVHNLLSETLKTEKLGKSKFFFPGCCLSKDVASQSSSDARHLYCSRIFCLFFADFFFTLKTVQMSKRAAHSPLDNSEKQKRTCMSLSIAQSRVIAEA